jgi:hypothetical protein
LFGVRAFFVRRFTQTYLLLILVHIQATIGTKMP